MGLGNGNPKEGDKGSNFNWELKVLQGLEAIAVALEGGGGLSIPQPMSSNITNLGILPTSADGLNMGDLYTQTAEQLGGIGTQKIICIL